MTKQEREFQRSLVKELKKKFEGAIVLKNDPNYIQGIPDLLLLFGKHWAALELKKAKESKHQANQDYYIRKMNKMSYASFVSPENKEEVLHELEQAFRL